MTTMTTDSQQAGPGRPSAEYTKLARRFQAENGRVVWMPEGYYIYQRLTGAYRLFDDKQTVAAQVGKWLEVAENVPKWTANLQAGVLTALQHTYDPDLELETNLLTDERLSSWLAMGGGSWLDVEKAASWMYHAGGRWPEMSEARFMGIHDDLGDNFFSTCAVPYEFDPTAQCPRFEKMLAGCQPNPANREILQMFAGLLLVDDTRFQRFWVGYGPGGCGKSQWLFILRALVGGDEHYANVPMQDFGDKHTVGQLTQYRANLVDDGPYAAGWLSGPATTILKASTGGSGAVLKYEPKFVNAKTTRRAKARHFFCQNDPMLLIADEALLQRLDVIPFTVHFRDTPRDKGGDLWSEIWEAEHKGIFSWAVRGLGLLRYKYGNRFPKCEDGKPVAESLRVKSNPSRIFLPSAYVPKAGTFTPIADIHTGFREFAIAEGYDPKRVPTVNEVAAAFKDAKPPVIVDRAWITREGRRRVQERGLRNLAPLPEAPRPTPPPPPSRGETPPEAPDRPIGDK